MQICFLASSFGTPAVKTFTKAGTLAYPQIKTFTSTSYEFPDTREGLQEKVKALQVHARRGDCLLKGMVTTPLKNVSRKNAVDREALTSNIVFDIDGVVLPGVTTAAPLSQANLVALAEGIIALLPEALRTVSYIAHASSSMGMKGNRVAFHLDFLLTSPVHPKQLKDYLLMLNFTVPTFDAQLDLSASGNSLRFPLDRCVADNSRLLYIGTPNFMDGIVDPIPKPDDRIFLVEKEALAFDLQSVLIDEEYQQAIGTLGKQTQSKVNNLRSIRGLPARKDRVSTVTVGGMQHFVVTNPDQVTMHFVEDRGDWVTYNINDGDSGAYYVHKLNPSIVHNFKNEPNFLFDVADPATYRWHLNNFVANKENAAIGAEKLGEVPLLPLVFRDYATNTYFNGLFNPLAGKMESVNRAGRESLGDFLIQHGAVLGDIVQTWTYEFQPWNKVAIDFNDLFINKYCQSPYFEMKITMPHRYIPLRYETAASLHAYCPRIWELICHALGNGIEEVNHFINWLAAALQSKQKNKTAWIFQGVQGTGKGQLFDRVIAPLAGDGANLLFPQTMKLKLENIEEQYNAWVESALFCLVDEFSINDSAASNKLFNKIKNLITEDNTTSRAHFSGARAVTSYTNYIFTANSFDIMFMPADDRRFNIAPRQEHKLERIWGEDTTKYLFTDIPEELPRFARIMTDFEVDMTKAHTALENDAKISMRNVSRTSVEEFVEAIRSGNLDYFIPILELPYGTPGLDYSTPAKAIIKSIIRDYDVSALHKITLDQLRILYNCIVGRSDNLGKFGKTLAHKGLITKQIRIGTLRTTGVEIMWGARENSMEDLKAVYVTEQDLAFVRSDSNVVKLKAHITI